MSRSAGPLKFGLVGAILTLLASAFGAQAQTGAWDSDSEFAQVRLVAAKDALDGSPTAQLGLEFEVAEGWNIYWRSPGPLGLPPELTWLDFTNVADSTLSWPVPKRYTYTFPGEAEEDGIQSLIYRDNVVLPLEVTLADPQAPLIAQARVDFMVCADLCIPASAQVRLDLFVDPDTGLSEHAAQINAYQSQVPASVDMAGGLALVAHSFDEASQTIRFEVQSLLALTAPDVMVEAPLEAPGFTFGKPVVQIAGDAMSAVVEVPVVEVGFSGETPLNTDFRLTLVDDKRGVDLGFVRIGDPASFMPALFEPSANASGGFTGFSGGGFAGADLAWSLPLLLVMAVLAGVILNFMPCVLPVLSLKLLAFVGKAEKGDGEIRASFLATAAGIIVSFWVLAALIAALKLAGTSVGWGLQFQSPWFVSAMIALMVVFAANMFGWFELPFIPGINAVGAGQSGLGGDFLTGALATLLATPCSAPILASVIGIALTGSVGMIFVLFTLIGVGMAAPYWLVVIWPAVARLMPKPGRWMNLLKLVLGLLLLGFAIWLLADVLLSQKGIWVALSVGLGVLVVLGILFLRRQAAAGLALPIASFTALLFLPIASAMVLPNQPLELGGEPEGEEIQWVAWDLAEIDQHLAQGRTVFVDVTASWCINCKVNKAVGLDVPQVQARFQDPDLIAMKADWTNPNPAIADYLASFRRAGIPFNVVYSPANPGGKVLPAVLTPSIVLEALDS